jgi:hypothetical protein
LTNSRARPAVGRRVAAPGMGPDPPLGDGHDGGGPGGARPGGDPSPLPFSRNTQFPDFQGFLPILPRMRPGAPGVGVGALLLRPARPDSPDRIRKRLTGIQMRGQAIVWILLKNPSDQKATVKKTMSDVSLDHSNRVQTKLARKNSRHFSRTFAYLQKEGVFQRNLYYGQTPLGELQKKQLRKKTGRTTFFYLISALMADPCYGVVRQQECSFLISFSHFSVFCFLFSVFCCCEWCCVLDRLLWQCAGRMTWLNLLSVRPLGSTLYRFQSGQRSARRPIFKTGHLKAQGSVRSPLRSKSFMMKKCLAWLIVYFSNHL